MTAYITITGIAALLICCFILYGRLREMEACAMIFDAAACQGREDALQATERYQATIDAMQIQINKLTLQLAARTWEQARSLEPNVITSVRRSDADLVKIAKEKAKQDEKEDKVYEQIGRVV